MNLYVGCINGVGKTTPAEKNDIFVDLDYICPYKAIILNKKNILLQNILNLNNKIILFNIKIDQEKNRFPVEQQKNYFFLNIKNIAKDLKTRIKKRETRNSLLNGLKKEEINCFLKTIDFKNSEYIKFVDNLKEENKITINRIEELNNLETILLSKFEELKNAENGRYNRSKEK